MTLLLNSLQFVIKILRFNVYGQKLRHKQINTWFFLLLLAFIHDFISWLELEVFLVLWQIFRDRGRSYILIGECWFDWGAVFIISIKRCIAASCINCLEKVVLSTVLSNWLNKLVLVGNVVEVLHCESCPNSLLLSTLHINFLFVIWNWKLLRKSWLDSCLWSFVGLGQICKGLQFLRWPTIKFCEVLGLHLIDCNLLWLWIHLSLKCIIWWCRLRWILPISCIWWMITPASRLLKLRKLGWLWQSYVWILWCFCIDWIILFWVIWPRLIRLSVCSCTIEVWAPSSFVSQSHSWRKACIEV